MSVVEYNPIELKPTATSENSEAHRLADALPVAIAQLDGDERLCFNNQTYEDWFGLSAREHSGRALQEILGEEIYQASTQHIQKARSGQRQVLETVLQRKDGSKRAVQIHYLPCTVSTGGILVMILDLNQFQQPQNEVQRLNAELEQRVRERTAQLEATNRELEAFCYSVSHDLRAPLRSVRGFTEVLLEQYAQNLDVAGRDFLRRVRDASSQMDKLVDDLLRLSRVSRSEIQRQEINLSRVAEEIVSELRKSDPSRNVTVTVASGLRANGDERLMRLVLDNLVRNAWKFTSKRSDAAIEVGRNDASDTFFVRDNGVGFDMAYAPRLFGVFQRLHSTVDFPGSGVGLAIVQRVINRHGGRVWAEGAVDAGAAFYFTLPAGCDS